MLRSVSVVTVNVSDHEKALDFFINKLGFKVHTDITMSDGFRWLEIAPPEGEANIALNKTMPNETKENKFSGFLFHADNVKRTYEELRAKGVEFTTLPVQQSWGWWSEFKDDDGNLYGVTQGEND